ncbi:hypothetical protein CCZ20_26410 [Priestia aryabhattai]|uniref:hypothetical protein n=1 Tax=Priestia aryabhattai TaxID=412384 RepID=UPI000B50726F|nr:hypothetical protein [Priestia aryabhattai]OVE34478.1 hypothetical protein CCZ20_26410 [Priestia aryabhattai]
MRKYRMLIIFLVIIFPVYSAAKLLFTDKQKISDEFAEQLYDYPIPPQTEVIKKGKSNGKFAGAFGNGGYWNTFSYMTLSSKLSQEEILDYYKNADLFISPQDNKKIIPVEIYFKGHFIKEKHFQNYYYTLDNGFRGFVTRYIDENGQIKEEYKVEKSSRNRIGYIIQIHGQFDYFPKIS